MRSRPLLACLFAFSLVHCGSSDDSTPSGAGASGAAGGAQAGGAQAGAAGKGGSGGAGVAGAGGGPAGGAGAAGKGGAGQSGAGTAGAAQGGAGSGGSVNPSTVGKVDVVFMVDNSASMSDKQKILAVAVPDLLGRLINPQCIVAGGSPLPKDQQPLTAADPCPAGATREFSPLEDIHIGVVTSSLGGHGADVCPDVDPATPGQTSSNNFTRDDHGHLITRGERAGAAVLFPVAETYNGEGFLAWDPTGTKNTPPGEADPDHLTKDFTSIILGADQIGCGFESQLEGWYRFLIDPNPLKSIKPPAQLTTTNPAVVTGTDEVLLQQRADFLRPDSLVSVIMLTDENDCSTIDGKLADDVCDKPKLDASGKPTGDCLEDRKGWPADYGVEGNMQGFTTDAEGRVSGSAFPINYVLGQISLSGNPFHPKSGTAACDTNPDSPDCHSCFSPGTDADPGCKQLDDTNDAPQLRCWDQRRRFGVDARYPVGRYVQGLTQPKVYDRDGNLVDNPLFQDLPFLAAKAAGKPLDRPQAPPRSARSVSLTGIVGVPWQDIAVDPTDLTQGYLPGVPGAQGGKSINWDLLLGDEGVRDPLLRETNETRSGKNVLGESISEVGWNSINGHEWEPGSVDLQYACIFLLPTPRDCQNVGSSCDCTPDTLSYKDPLCETPIAGDLTGKGDGVSTTTQFRAKAYPGLRYFSVLRLLKDQGILASICAPNVTDNTRADYGYRPAVNALVEQIKTNLPTK